jgi:hypothetical protein
VILRRDKFAIVPYYGKFKGRQEFDSVIFAAYIPNGISPTDIDTCVSFLFEGKIWLLSR